MVQGVVIGVIGTVAGTILGVIFALTVSDILGFINQVFNLNLFDAYFVNYLPSELRLLDVVFITGASFILSFWQRFIQHAERLKFSLPRHYVMSNSIA